MSPHRGCKQSQHIDQPDIATRFWPYFTLLSTKYMVYCQKRVFFFFSTSQNGPNPMAFLRGSAMAEIPFSQKKKVWASQFWRIGPWETTSDSLQVEATIPIGFLHFVIIHWGNFFTIIWCIHISGYLSRGPLRWRALSHGAWSNKKLRNFSLLGQIYNAKKKKEIWKNRKNSLVCISRWQKDASCSLLEGW